LTDCDTAPIAQGSEPPRVPRRPTRPGTAWSGLAAISILLAGCGGGGGSSATSTPTAATPSFSPPGASYSAAQGVTVDDATPGAAIYYTTDGSSPTTGSMRYIGPITVQATATLEAIAVAPGYLNSGVASATYIIAMRTALPVIAATSGNGAQNGAQIVSLHDATAGAVIHYTVDGSPPTAASPVYEAPFLVASNLTVKAIAVFAGYQDSDMATQSFAPNMAPGTLVWSDEFANATGGNVAPNPQIWTYDVGNNGWGNAELQDYCSWGSTKAPCASNHPNAYVGTDGYLHIVAQQPSPGVYTSARLKTQGLFSFQYGRFEVRVQVPEAQGLWPAAWLMGNNMATVNWPACGEMDVQERVNAAATPDVNVGSIHGPGFTGGNVGTVFRFPAGQTAATFHTYGMTWSPGRVAYYVDNPAAPYAVYTPTSIAGFPGAVWPFDSGGNFILLNLAVGGNYPGAPAVSTPFPSETMVDYVRVYAN
jgi:beta-glucanase (GH16 family)